MTTENLDIDSKTVEELYEWYLQDNLLVNRRYQRKLVWSIDEKRALISSLIKKYPIPLLLFVKTEDKREILDGMQRLEAIMSFVEQRYDFDGHYFDLDSIALTKSMKDQGALIQKEPILSREKSVDIARYRFAISEYSSTSQDIDEVFRRINSNGKTLSKQEIRNAGVTSNFSELVRNISIGVRGDSSHSDILSLNKMHIISISNDALSYGINIEEHFYIKNNIISKKNVRESTDEELVAHILGYIMMADKPNSGPDILDGFYGLKDTTHTLSHRNALDVYIQKNSPEVIIEKYMYIYQTLVQLFEGVNFKKHILGEESKSHECPRYYQAVFLAFYQLIIDEKMEIDDPAGLMDSLKESAGRIITVNEGHLWTSDSRKKSIDNLAAIIKRYFKLSNEGFENTAWITKINSILMNSRTEQPHYDFKQGIYDLDEKHKFSKSCFSGILETCVAIHNISKDVEGHILIGVAENTSVCEKIKEIYGVCDYHEVNGFYITGIDGEVSNVKGGYDGYFLQIKQKIESSTMSEKLKQQILKDIRQCDYKGKHVVKILIKGTGEIATINNKFYIRQGSATKPIEDAQSIVTLCAAYNES